MYFFWGYFDIFNMKAIHHYKMLWSPVWCVKAVSHENVMHFLTEAAPYAQCVFFLCDVCMCRYYMYVCE